ncbi:MAG: ATP-binding protein [Tepidisphaeraceae bacterium]
MPRRACMYQEQPLIVLHLLSDALIAAAYYSIPFALVYFVRRRRDLAFSWMFWLFALFILACGTTHVLGVIAIWSPVYRFDGMVKGLTAALSIGTAAALWPLIPRALLLPSPSQLELTVTQRTAELADANAALRSERDEKALLLEREKTARTHAEQMQREAERNARLAEEANQLKDEFLATLSHELRTPLTAILGWARVLERSHKHDKNIAPAAEVIHRNARAQAHLVDDLLDMNRIVSGKLQLDMKPVRLSEVLDAATDSIQPAVNSKQITFIKAECDANTVVLGDAARLQQVLWNLLSNAAKFTPAGGRIDVSCQVNERTATIVVRDSGEGIAPDFLPLVFDRFRQADASVTRRFGGLGLGLSIVRHLVEMHGGTILAESPGLGRGATFTVELPVSNVGEKLLESSTDSVTGEQHLNVSLRGVEALVIEDDTDTRELIAELLGEAGARVFLTSNTTEGDQLLRRHRPDVIVCDIGMPGEDGYTFIRRVRADRDHPGRDTPAIALTAFARPEDRVQALLAGFQLHVPKPIEDNELLLVVASLAKRPSDRD